MQCASTGPRTRLQQERKGCSCISGHPSLQVPSTATAPSTTKPETPNKYGCSFRTSGQAEETRFSNMLNTVQRHRHKPSYCGCSGTKPCRFSCCFMGILVHYSLQSGSDIHSTCRTAQCFLGSLIKVLLNLVATTGMIGLCVLVFLL